MSLFSIKAVPLFIKNTIHFITTQMYNIQVGVYVNKLQIDMKLNMSVLPDSRDVRFLGNCACLDLH